MRQFRSNPLDDDADERLSFDDLTVLTAVAVIGLVTVAIFALGLVCAAHRIGVALETL